ncbi:MAG TPA: fasciclin domain-containing protein [Prolixibacteraceae bacterium]|nr:fasciclin domain-containing protein [Prolixibacteraceae bacterium]
MNFLSTKPILIVFFVTLTLLGLQGCNEGKDRFEDPPWLGGSSIETLKENGNYTIFLALMDKAGYTEPISKQLFTLFVPDDNAFKTYFASIGKNSVDDLSDPEAVELFTLHILKNPRSRYQLIYEYAYEEEQGPTGEYASLFFRKPTYCQALPYKELPKYVASFKDSIWIYSEVKEMPVFSTDWFEDVFGDVNGSDYLMLYPDGQWPSTGLCWGPAAVIDQEVRTANGFIYYLDRVVPPQPNLEKYLNRNQDKYGVFYDLLQRFAKYTNITSKDNIIMREKTYDQVSDIANEEGPSTGDPLRMRDMFTVYIPSNEVFADYLNNTFLKSFSSIDSIPKITLYYLVQSQILNSLALISKSSNGYFNSFGDAITLSKNDIVTSHMCSNGVLYETNRVFEPNAFTCVPGKLFWDKNYSAFLHAVDQSGLLRKLTNPDQVVTLFAPSNDELDAYGIRYDDDAGYLIRYVNNTWQAMKTSEIITLVQDHIHNGKVPDLNGEGYLEMSSGSYIHYVDNKIEGAENVTKDKVSSIVERDENKINGMLYTVNEPIMTNYRMGDCIYENPEFSDFAGLLVKLRLLVPDYVDPNTGDSIANLKIGTADQWTAFIPTNSAMAKARSAGLVPDVTQKDALRKFVQYHFVKNVTLFDDGKISGSYETPRTESSSSDGIVYSTVTINNSPQILKVTDHSGNTVIVDHKDANVLVRNGVVHAINTVLTY